MGPGGPGGPGSWNTQGGKGLSDRQQYLVEVLAIQRPGIYLHFKQVPDTCYSKQIWSESFTAFIMITVFFSNNEINWYSQCQCRNMYNIHETIEKRDWESLNWWKCLKNEMKENLHKNFLLTNISNENIEWEENSLPLHHCLLHPLQYLAPPSNRARVTIITNNSLSSTETWPALNLFYLLTQSVWMKF